MKLMFASDIHGDYNSMLDVKSTFDNEKADKLVLCGDLLYHGPRNDLPPSYNPKGVIELLNSMSDKIISVRGNCDGEVDQMVLDFPILADFTLIYDFDLRIYVTHGHVYSPENPLKLKNGDIMVSGHTHIYGINEDNGNYFINPGSASIPKENNPKSYMVYENKTFTIKTFDAQVLKTLNLN